MATVNIYLNFPGNCEEAFQFYRSILGGEFAMVMRFAEVPGEQPVSDADAQKIMHISYLLDNGTRMMGSDRHSTMGLGNPGDNFSISLNMDSDDEAQRAFDALAAGGQITMPIQKTFWGSYFGMLTDKFGIQWMVAHDPAAPR